MTRNLNKAQRLLEILELLKRKERTSKELADWLSVPIRTIQRDIKELKEQHSIEYTEKNTYFIREVGSNLNSVEALAVHAAARLLYHHSPTGNRFYKSALEKLANMLPEPVKAIALRSVTDLSNRSGDDRTLEICARAWFEGHVLAFEYLSTHGSGNWRPKQLEVYFIEINRNNLAAYAIGFERSYHKRIQTWKLSRMRNAQLLNDRYTIPKDFDPQHYLSTAWGIIGTSGGPTVTVKLKFNKEATSRIREGGYTNLEIKETYPDSAILVEVLCGSDSKGFPLEILSWVQSWGSKVEVKEPENLRQRWLEEAQHVASLLDV